MNGPVLPPLRQYQRIALETARLADGSRFTTYAAKPVDLRPDWVAIDEAQALAFHDAAALTYGYGAVSITPPGATPWAPLHYNCRCIVKEKETRMSEATKPVKRTAPKSLAETLLEAVTAAYPEDPSKPGLVVSYLGAEGYYCSVSRYTETFGRGRILVAKATKPTLSEALEDVARTWFAAYAPAEPAIRALRRALETL